MFCMEGLGSVGVYVLEHAYAGHWARVSWHVGRRMEMVGGEAWVGRGGGGLGGGRGGEAKGGEGRQEKDGRGWGRRDACSARTGRKPGLRRDGADRLAGPPLPEGPAARTRRDAATQRPWVAVKAGRNNSALP